jgi:uncharacterized membrane protein
MAKEQDNGIDVQDSVTVNAPVDKVYKYWSELENFPNFMSHVKEVSKTDRKTYHWKVTGPVGTRFEWEAQVTTQVPNERLAWKTIEGASVESQGEVSFRATSRDTTRVDVRMSYRPPGGAVGHAIAKLLGADPKAQMDDDLARFKELVESDGSGDEHKQRAGLGSGTTEY